jgi:hypothetical protein
MDKIRNGNFTSSEIVALMSMGYRKMTDEELAIHKKEFPKSQKKNIECWPGDAAITYIQECNWERKLGRSITIESDAKPLTWGKLVERRAFDLLGIEYRLCSDETIAHNDIDCWYGSPDVETIDSIGDIKSPITLKSFLQLVDPLYNGLSGLSVINKIRDNHKDGDKYYYQLVSNAILKNKNYAELIIYLPYKSELDIIRELAFNLDSPRQHKYKWIGFADDDELPWIPDGGFYKNLNIIRFEVPESDKIELHKCVMSAAKELNKLVL